MADHREKSGRGSREAIVPSDLLPARHWKAGQMQPLKGILVHKKSGRLYDLDRRELSKSIGKDSYLKVKGIAVHRIVCATIHGEPPNGLASPQVRHLDGNRFDNRPGNLAWGSPQDNGHDRLSAEKRALKLALKSGTAVPRSATEYELQMSGAPDCSDSQLLSAMAECYFRMQEFALDHPGTASRRPGYKRKGGRAAVAATHGVRPGALQRAIDGTGAIGRRAQTLYQAAMRQNDALPLPWTKPHRTKPRYDETEEERLARLASVSANKATGRPNYEDLQLQAALEAELDFQHSLIWKALQQRYGARVATTLRSEFSAPNDTEERAIHLWRHPSVDYELLADVDTSEGHAIVHLEALEPEGHWDQEVIHFSNLPLPPLSP